ncbi:MAG: RNA-binding cell elongation regulator Jag/EloR [Dehalococcoidia bacterium]
MNQAEASGKTVEDALASALAKLGARQEEVEFVVLDEGRRGGLFGRGSKEATVRVTRLAPEDVVADAPQPLDTRIPRATPTAGRAGGGERGGRDRGTGFGARGRSGQSRGVGAEQAVPRLTESDFMRPRGERPVEAPPSRGGGGGGGRPDRTDRPVRSAPSRPPRPPRERRPEEYVAPDINAEDVELAATVLDDMLRIFDVPAEITIREPVTAGDGLGSVRAVIDLSGEGLGLLIGRRGDTLYSIQYLVNLIVSRRFPDMGGVTIDVEHYRHRREEQVISLAKRMADRVRETGGAITLEPMAPNERRLIHLAFADDPELMTNSVGEGESRKVVISPRQ